MSLCLSLWQKNRRLTPTQQWAVPPHWISFSLDVSFRLDGVNCGGSRCFQPALKPASLVGLLPDSHLHAIQRDIAQIRLNHF